MSLRRQTTRIVPPLLRERTFRRYWTGQTISLFGDQVSILALPLTAVLVLHAGAAQTGYLTAAGLAPSLLFSIVAGGWVDRKGHRRRVMLTADLVRAVLLASLPITYLAGVLTFAQLYAVAFLVGCASVLFNVAQGTVFASLVRPTDYVAANSLIHGSRALSFVGGQSAGGVLVQLVTAPGAILIDACSFLASALFLRSIHPREPLTAAGGRGHLLEGVRFIAHSREVRALLLATATINVFNFMEAAIFVLYAIRSLGLTPAQLGLVLGIGAVGAVIGAALTSRVARRLGVGGAFTLSCVVFPASFILIPVAGGMGKPAILALLFAAFAQAVACVAQVSRLPMVAGWDGLLPGWFSVLHPRFRTPVRALWCVVAACVIFGAASLIQAGEQEATQLLFGVAFGCCGIYYLILFAVVLWGRWDGEHRAPWWLKMPLKVAACSAAAVTVLSVVFQVVPILDVAQPFLFAAKVGGMMVLLNGIGAWIYMRGRNRYVVGQYGERIPLA